MELPVDADIVTLPECVICNRKKCRTAPVWKLDICEYGISYVNDGQTIQRANASGTLRHLAQNLRHELNKVLQVVVSEACKIDPSVSTRRIIPSNPASKIVGAALIIDHFINMISGVNDFHADPVKHSQLGECIALVDVVEKCIDIYGIIVSTHRAASMKVQMSVSDTIEIRYATSIVEYMIAVLIDNTYKHAIDESLVRIYVENVRADMIDLVFENQSKLLQQPDRIFAKGYQEKKTSDGFGFGLFWAQILVDSYNAGSESECRMQLCHEQDFLSVDYEVGLQRFIIRNIRLA